MSQTNILKDYTIGKVLGAGSFAVVYQAVHKPTNKVVAIKSIKPKLILNADTVHYVETEIEIMRTIQHPHLIGCQDYIKSDSHVYLVMEYCSMGDLSTYIRETHNSQGMPEDIILHFLDQLASGLKYLHDQNLIHRDIKPKNIFLVPPATGSATDVPDVKLGDFGFAKTLPKTSLAMSVLGSPIYMAPEVFKRQPYNYKADLWSLGVVLFELMTGHTLFQSTNMENLRTTVDEYRDQIPFEKEGKYEHSSELKDLVKVLLKRNPEERASCEDFSHHLNLVVERQQQPQTEQPQPKQPQPEEEQQQFQSWSTDGSDFQQNEDDYVVIDASIRAPTPPLIPNIQRSHSVDYYYQKKSAPPVRDRRHSAGSNGSMLTRAISMSPFNLFNTYKSATTKAQAPSSSASTIAEESLTDDEDVPVKCFSDNLHCYPSLDVRLFEISTAVIRLFDHLLESSSGMHSSRRPTEEQSVALMRKITFFLNKVTTVKPQHKYTMEENNLLQWGKTKLSEFTLHQSNFKKMEIDQRVIQRLLYNHAVEMSREAAVYHLVGEDLYSCKAKFKESILLLEAVLIIPPNEHVKPKDVEIIENLIRNLQLRILKVSSSQVSCLQKEIETLKL